MFRHWIIYYKRDKGIKGKNAITVFTVMAFLPFIFRIDNITPILAVKMTAFWRNCFLPPAPDTICLHMRLLGVKGAKHHYLERWWTVRL